MPIMDAWAALAGVLVAAVAVVPGWDDRRRYLYAGERLNARSDLLLAATRYADRVFWQREDQQGLQVCDLAAGPILAPAAAGLRDATFALGRFAYVVPEDGALLPAPFDETGWSSAWRVYDGAASSFAAAVKRELETDRLSPLTRL